MNLVKKIFSGLKIGFEGLLAIVFVTMMFSGEYVLLCLFLLAGCAFDAILTLDYIKRLKEEEQILKQQQREEEYIRKQEERERRVRENELRKRQRELDAEMARDIARSIEANEEDKDLSQDELQDLLQNRKESGQLEQEQ